MKTLLASELEKPQMNRNIMQLMLNLKEDFDKEIEEEKREQANI